MQVPWPAAQLLQRFSTGSVKDWAWAPARYPAWQGRLSQRSLVPGWDVYESLLDFEDIRELLTQISSLRHKWQLFVTDLHP